MADMIDLVEKMQGAEAFSNIPAPLQTALFLGSLTLIPAALVCLTSFSRIAIVLSFVRRAVTSQDIPPNLVLTGLALFLTLFTMGPTLARINEKAIQPYLDKQVTGPAAIRAGFEQLQGEPPGLSRRPVGGDKPRRSPVAKCKRRRQGMSVDQVIEISRDLFYTAMLVALPALAVSFLVGLIVSIFQTVTSIQDQTLS